MRSSWPCGYGSLLRRQGRCTSGTRGRRSTTGCSRAGRAASSCCGSRTPTASGRRPRTSRRSSTRSSGSGSTGTRGRSTSPQNAERHAEVVEQLIADGHAYRSTAGPDEVKAFKEQHGNRGFRGEDEGTGAVRLRVPDEGVTVVNDVIRGESPFENALLDDLVIARARRHAGLPPRRRGRRRRRRHHPRRPRRRPLLEHAQADAHPAGDGRADAGLRPPAAAARAGRQEARQAARRHIRAGPARRRLPAGGGPQLPRAARLGLRRGDDIPHDRRAAGALQPRAGLQVAGRVRRAEAALDERPLPARARCRRSDRSPGGADRPQRTPRCGGDLAGQDLHAVGVLAAHALLLRRPGGRSGGPRAGARGARRQRGAGRRAQPRWPTFRSPGPRRTSRSRWAMWPTGSASSASRFSSHFAWQ